MVALTQADADEYTRLRRKRHSGMDRLKPQPFPKLVEKKPQTLRCDDEQARAGDIPGAVVPRKTVKRRR